MSEERTIHETIFACLEAIKDIRDPLLRRCNVMRSIGQEDPIQRAKVDAMEESIDAIRAYRDGLDETKPSILILQDCEECGMEGDPDDECFFCED